MAAIVLESYPQRMTIIALLVTYVVVGLLLWLVNSFIPMDAKIKQILNVVVVILLVLWLLQAFGVFGMLDRPILEGHHR